MCFTSRHFDYLLFAAFTFSALQSAVADDSGRTPRAPLLPKYQQECTSCHLAYPPGMLPSASWQGIVNNLQRHYGTDASLDAATARELSSWLTANSGTYRRVREQPPEDRITRSGWFIREHRKVPAETWRFPAVKTPANCTACHTQADQGDFNERNIRIPR